MAFRMAVSVGIPLLTQTTVPCLSMPTTVCSMLLPFSLRASVNASVFINHQGEGECVVIHEPLVGIHGAGVNPGGHSVCDPQLDPVITQGL